LCSKALRLATSPLPENSCPLGPRPTELCLNGVLRSSPAEMATWHTNLAQMEDALDIFILDA
jgi:hypothetical protein